MSWWASMFGFKSTKDDALTAEKERFTANITESKRLAEEAQTEAESATDRARHSAAEALALLRGVKQHNQSRGRVAK